MSELPNLYRDLMRTVTADHGGDGDLRVYRAFGPRHAAMPEDADGLGNAVPEPLVAHIDLVVVPPGSSIGRHRHGHDRETYVLLRGRARMYCAGQEFPVGPGDVAVNQPLSEHGLVNTSAADVHLLVFEVVPVQP